MADAGLLGALGGLGEGLMQVGMTQFKSVLAEKLNKQREDTEEERLIAREERAERRLRARPDPKNQTFIEREGALFRQQRNVYGDVLDESLATPDEIATRNYNQQKRDEEIKKLSLGNALTEARTDQVTGKMGLEQDLLRERISTTRKQGDAALIRANKPSGGSRSGDSDGASKGSIGEYAELLKKQSKDLFAQYAADDDTLTASEQNDLARQAVTQAAQYGLDPQELLEQLLEERLSGMPGAIRVPLPSKK